MHPAAAKRTCAFGHVPGLGDLPCQVLASAQHKGRGPWVLYALPRESNPTSPPQDGSRRRRAVHMQTALFDVPNGARDQTVGPPLADWPAGL